MPERGIRLQEALADLGQDQGEHQQANSIIAGSYEEIDAPADATIAGTLMNR